MDRFEFIFDVQNHLISMDEAVTFATRPGRNGTHFRSKVGDYSFRVDRVGRKANEDGKFRLQIMAKTGLDLDGKLEFAVESAAIPGVVVKSGKIRFFADNPMAMARVFVEVASIVDSIQ